jgi:hypothetical protein
LISKKKVAVTMWFKYIEKIRKLLAERAETERKRERRAKAP